MEFSVTHREASKQHGGAECSSGCSLELRAEQGQEEIFMLMLLKKSMIPMRRPLEYCV